MGFHIENVARIIIRLVNIDVNVFDVQRLGVDIQEVGSLVFVQSLDTEFVRRLDTTRKVIWTSYYGADIKPVWFV